MAIMLNGGIFIKTKKMKFALALIMLVMPRTLAFGQTTAEDWLNQGSALYNQSKYDEAIKAFDKAIEIDPQLEQAWYYKGMALKGLGKYEEAIQAYDKVLEINPRYAGAWYHKGMALNLLGLTAESHSAYSRAKKLVVS